MKIKKFFHNIFHKKKPAPGSPGQLFFIGNKRSGTTVLAQKINLHPDIHITHETDIIWILYRLYNGLPFEFYPKDEPHSTIVTLEQCRHILNNYQAMTPLECYRQCQHHLMKNGTKWMPGTDKRVILLGDKKPNQQSEPRVNDWVQANFFNTSYIHIVRHPIDFLYSIPRLPEEFDLGARYGSSKCKNPIKILETWAYFENLVLEEKKRARFPIHSVKFEDFCDRPAEELSKIWIFTGLSIPHDLQEKINQRHDFGIMPGGLHKGSRGNHFDGPISGTVRQVMDIYHYD